MNLKLKTATTELPVSLVEAKQHCHVDFDDDDALITLYIKSAAAHIEGNRGVMGRALLNQDWELYADEFPCGDLTVPLGPLVSVASVEYLDQTTGNYVTWASSNYTVDMVSFEGRISPVDSWPSTLTRVNAVRVTFTAGHGADASTLPADIKAALLMLIGHWYSNREAVGDVGTMTVPLTFDSLIGAVSKISI